MPGKVMGYRNRLFRAIHAEALKRNLSHDELHDICKSRYQVHSMSELTEVQLLLLYREWTGKTLRMRGALPKRGETVAAEEQMISGEDLVSLDQEFAKRGLEHPGRENFIRRQLRGRSVMRTRKDFVRVMSGIRAMNRREGL